MTLKQFILYLLRLIFLPNSPKTMEWQMLRLLNKDRRQHGLKPVIMQSDLQKVARKHSQDMAKNDYFSHTNEQNLSPADRLKKGSVTDNMVGENLAKIRGYGSPTRKAEIGLMQSPGHRANILHKDYNCVGIGVVKAENGTYYYTQNFARREIILAKKIPTRLRPKKNLTLKGKVLSSKTRLILYQIVRDETIIDRGDILVLNKKFSRQLKFKHTGHYQINLFTQAEKNLFRGINQFDLTVKKSWFF